MTGEATPGGTPAGATRIVLATRTPGKLTELRRILAASRVDAGVDDLSAYPGMAEVPETGATFAENAVAKARAAAAWTGLPAVGDDSGLCVDALNGMPGVLSARWSGRHGDDEANLRLVLGQLADVPAARRGAHFTCAAALVLPSGGEHVTEGSVYGRLTDSPRGTGGFGYDPIFVPDGFEVTTAQMGPDEKYKISHRGRALRALAPVIAALNGHAFGGGAEVAVAADIRVAADDIKIAFNQVALQIMPAWGGAERLAKLVGKSKALLLAGSGTVLDAADAERIGLIDRIFPREAFDAGWRSIARSLANRPAAEIKRVIAGVSPDELRRVL